MSEYIYNKNQLKAIEFPPSPLLIIAGAGTGKTTTIVGRINYFLNILKINPKSILALTFTSNAAKHLHNKIEVKNNLENENINATTFHSFAQSQTNKYYKELSYTSPPLLMNQGDVYYLLRSRFNEIQNLQSQFFKRDPLSAIKCFYSVFNGFRQNLLTNKELNRLRSNELNRLDDEVDEVEIEKILQISDMVNMYPLYQNWKKELNRVDYGDLLLNIWQLIKNKDNAYNEIRNKYKHIIVDEFQDNNYALSIIIQKLASPENSITVVGDDDQCIYAFRQANISNIYDFKKKYCIEDNEPIALMHNYRSNQMILDIANNIISKNKQRLSKGELKSNILSNQEPKLYIGEANQQMFQIYKNISEFINSGENLNNIAILLRTHSQCLKMKKYLDGFGINSYYHSANIYEQALVKDIVSTIYILSKNSKSDQALFRLLQKEFSYDKINNLYEEYKNSSSKYFLDYLKNNKKYNNLLNRIIDLNLLSKGFNIKDIIWKIMIFRKSYFNNQSFVSSKENKKIQTINQFRQIIESYCKHYNSNDINSFCKYLEVQMEINNEKLEPLDILSNTESVQIMTIHAAKGKEYKHVFIPFLRTGSFPLNYKKMHIINRLPLSWQRWNEFDKNEKELHLEEERRLFYVGITRAMKSLFLFAPLKAQSIFIKELDDKLIKQEILMSNNKELDKIDYLEGEFQSQIQKEIRLENFKVANFLLNAIENISLLKKNKKLKWKKNNPFKNSVEKLKNYKINVSNNKIKLSATSIMSYDTCPLQYKYKYIYKIPGGPQKSYFELGKLVHKVLEIYHNSNYSSFSNMLTILKKSWKDINYTYDLEGQQCFLDAKEMLSNYWNFLKDNPVNKVLTEHSFNFETESANISGKCDRIDISDNSISILDYKTSKNYKNENQLKKDIQMGIYALFLLNKGLKIDGEIIKKIPDSISMLFLRNNKPEVKVKIIKEDLERTYDKINQTVEGITNSNFEGKKGVYCDWCDYRELICPLYG